MGGQLLVPQRRTALSGRGLVHSDAGFHGVWAEVPTGAGREEGIVAVTTTFLSPDTQDRDVAGGQRDTALLAAFTLASNVSVGVELDVAAGEPGQLGKPQPCLHGQGDQCVIAPSLPAVPVRGGEQRIDFG